jgi:hypothetical protein
MASQTQTVWQTDSYGVLIGPLQADPSPLEPGVYLVPAGCVTVAPPAVSEGMRARWTVSGWVVEPVPTPRWRLLRSTLIGRLTDEEAAALDAAIAALPPKTRQRWLAARWLWSDDPDVLAAAAALAWAPERVADLLAPDPDPELALMPAGAD